MGAVLNPGLRIDGEEKRAGAASPPEGSLTAGRHRIRGNDGDDRARGHAKQHGRAALEDLAEQLGIHRARVRKWDLSRDDDVGQSWRNTQPGEAAQALEGLQVQGEGKPSAIQAGAGTTQGRGTDTLSPPSPARLSNPSACLSALPTATKAVAERTFTPSRPGGRRPGDAKAMRRAGPASGSPSPASDRPRGPLLALPPSSTAAQPPPEPREAEAEEAS